MGTEFQFYKMKSILEVDGGDDPSSLGLGICFILSLVWGSFAVLISFTLVIVQCASYHGLKLLKPMSTNSRQMNWRRTWVLTFLILSCLHESLEIRQQTVPQNPHCEVSSCVLCCCFNPTLV